MLQGVADVESRERALKAMADEKSRVSARIDRVMATLPVDEDDLQETRCGGRVGCFPLPWRTGRQRVARDEGMPARSASGADVRLFGQHKQQSSASDKLATAAKNVEAHVEQLSEKASLARARAAQLMSAGKKAEAMASLKKAKMLEKQLETATQTHAALETQVDVLAQSALQREVASALSASVSTSKKKSKGLLSRTETAVDEAAELKDLAEDISNVMGGLQNDVWDEEDLEAELAELSTPAVSTKAVRFQEVTPKDAGEVVVGVELGAFPAAPTALPTSEGEEGVAASM